MTEEQMEVVRLHMRDTYDVAPWEWDSGELELAIYELITKNQAKNNDVLDLVSKSFTPTIGETVEVIESDQFDVGALVQIIDNHPQEDIWIISDESPESWNESIHINNIKEVN